MLDRISWLGLFLGFSLLAQAEPSPGMGGAAMEARALSPTLKIDTAIYHMESGALQYAFTFTNPTDSVVFLDCQLPPFAKLSGGVLTLTFDRNALRTAWANAATDPVSADSSVEVPGASGARGASLSSGGGGGHGVSNSGTGRAAATTRTSLGVLAGGPADGSAANPEDFPPQRVGAHQTFQGQRKLDRILGDWNARPVFAKVQLRMAVLPERAEGEGAPYVAERAVSVGAAAKNVVRKGKAPVPSKVKRFRVPD